MQYIIVILFLHIIVCFVLEGCFLTCVFIIVFYAWTKFFRPIPNACCRITKKRAPASHKLLIGICNGVGNIPWVQLCCSWDNYWVWQKSNGYLILGRNYYFCAICFSSISFCYYIKLEYQFFLKLYL